MSQVSDTAMEAGHKLITSDRIAGTPVFDKDGDRMGHIDKLSIDKVSGQVRYALMSFGGFLGIGERYHPLPWDALRYDVDKDGYTVGVDKDRLKDAPSYTRDELEAFGGGESYPEELYAYYGMGPFW
jgi:hypothetical protein